MQVILRSKLAEGFSLFPGPLLKVFVEHFFPGIAVGDGCLGDDTIEGKNDGFEKIFGHGGRFLIWGKSRNYLFGLVWFRGLSFGLRWNADETFSVSDETNVCGHAGGTSFRSLFDGGE
jgi:hypothetical protein